MIRVNDQPVGILKFRHQGFKFQRLDQRTSESELYGKEFLGLRTTNISFDDIGEIDQLIDMLETFRNECREMSWHPKNY